MTLPTTVTKYVSHPLTPERRQDLLEELSKTTIDKGRLQQHQDELVRRHKEVLEKSKEIIKVRERVITDCAIALSDGMEMLPIECSIEYLLDQNLTRVKNKLTNALLEERAMTNEERAAIIDESDGVPRRKR